MRLCVCQQRAARNYVNKEKFETIATVWNETGRRKASVDPERFAYGHVIEFVRKREVDCYIIVAGRLEAERKRITGAIKRLKRD